VPAKPTGKRAAIIGSGPAGLTAAYYLARKGHSVAVFEALALPGGKMMHSIRDWHLPKHILLQEVRDIEKAGVRIETGSRIDSIDELFDRGFETVLLAAGLHRHQAPTIEVEASISGKAFLDGAGNAIMKTGDWVVILGGGKTAFECALKARRLGAAEVHLVSIEYRGGHESEIWQSELAVEAGAVVHSWRVFPRVVRQGGRITGVERYKMRAFGFDEDGRCVSDPVESSRGFIAADVVIDALGLDKRRDDIYRRPGFFCAGDAVSELRSVIEAVAGGRWAATAMDRFLGGDGNIDEHFLMDTVDETHRLVTRSSSANRPEVRTTMMPGGYAQVDLTLSKEVAVKEAGRCLRCDLLYPVTRFSIDVEACNHCGQCLEVCHWGALLPGSDYRVI
jgi:NADPH-dependent glutamate synthase beta subunit-like oxidoreductase